MSIGLRAVSYEERSQLRAMLGAYLAELSQYGDVNPGYPYFEAYWHADERRWAYFLLRGEEVIGFAMVNTISSTERAFDFVMAEFSILPAARRGGLGIAAAVAVFRAHPGAWQLAIMARNAAAHSFWPRAIAAAGANEVSSFEHDEDTIFEFVID